MKICSICLKNDLLCNACNKKLESGSISQADVAVSLALFRLGIPSNFIKAFDAKERIVIVADKKNSGMLIGRGGRNAKRLGTMLGKNVRIIEHVNDEKKLIESVISSPILGINKIYGNNEIYKIRIEDRFRRRVDNMSGVVGKVLNKNVKFVFE